MVVERERERARAGGGTLLTAKTGVPVVVSAVPEIAPGVFWRAIVERCSSGARLAALVPQAAGENAPRSESRLLAVLVDDVRGGLELARTRLPDGMYPSLSPRSFRRPRRSSESSSKRRGSSRSGTPG